MPAKSVTEIRNITVLFINYPPSFILMMLGMGVAFGYAAPCCKSCRSIQETYAIAMASLLILAFNAGYLRLRNVQEAIC